MITSAFVVIFIITLLIVNFFSVRCCKECGIKRFSYQLMKEDMGCNMCKGGD